MLNRLALSILVLAVSSSTLLAQAVAKVPAARPAGPDEKGIMGAGRAVRVKDISAGRFRSQLEALPAAAQQKALAKLESMTFHKNDIAELRADKGGGVYYVCSFGHTHGIPEPPAAEAPASKEKDPPIGHAAVPNSTPPIYHSKPGATNVLFLDFNGHIIDNTAWTNNLGQQYMEAIPYDTNGNTNEFSDAEQAAISQIWAHVAEDYSGFDVDVTTEEPASWNRYTGHALITETTDNLGNRLPHYDAGGIAYVGVFGDVNYSYDYTGPWDIYSPAWVTDMSVANIAEAASHELGHNMGLSHDGKLPSTVYYSGHSGGGVPSWGPIMGTGYGQNISQWCKGEYYNANQSQDDLAIIAGRLGYRTDDYGDTSGTAGSMIQNGIQVAATGVVETTGDVDVFAVPTGAGTVSLSLQTPKLASVMWGGNLDAALVLYDGVGTMLASNNLAGAVTASVSVAVSAGTYYAHVIPVGAGDPMNATPSGYTVYGSCGQYTLEGTVAVVGDTVILTSPNGGETLYRGSTNAITWSAGFTNSVNIDLYRAGVPVSSIASGVSNSGSYAWAISSGQAFDSEYSIRITKVGDAGNYDDSDAYFSIQEAPAALIDENFDDSGSIPAGWSNVFVSGSTTWKIQSGGQGGGSNPGSAYSAPNNATLYVAGYGDYRTRLMTPVFDSRGYTNVVLTFQHCMIEWPNDVDFLTVLYSTNSGSSWTTIANYTNEVTSWTERVIPLTSYGESSLLAFEGDANYGYGVCIDDVAVLAIGSPTFLDVDVDSMDDRWETEHSVTDPNGDADSDGATNYEEFIMGTDPNDDTKFLRVVTIDTDSNGKPVITWHSQQDATAPQRRYKVQRRESLMSGNWSDVLSDVTPDGSTTERTDLTIVSSNGMYRIIVY